MHRPSVSMYQTHSVRGKPRQLHPAGRDGRPESHVELPKLGHNALLDHRHWGRGRWLEVVMYLDFRLSVTDVHQVLTNHILL